MTSQNAAQYLPLVQALADGKVIEGLSTGGNWWPLNDPTFTQPVSQYRVKPEPRRVFVTTYAQRVDGFGSAHKTREAAEDKLLHDGEVFEFIELTPEVREKLNL